MSSRSFNSDIFTFLHLKKLLHSEYGYLLNFKDTTLPKYVYGGDDDERFDDRSNSSQETNAIPTNIIERRTSIEDDRPLGAGGSDTFSMMSTPPASPPLTPHPWQETTDAFSVGSDTTVQKMHIEHQQMLPEAVSSEPPPPPSSFSSTITSQDSSSSSNPVPISVIVQRRTTMEDRPPPPPLEEPNSADPYLSFTAPPPPLPPPPPS